MLVIRKTRKAAVSPIPEPLNAPSSASFAAYGLGCAGLVNLSEHQIHAAGETTTRTMQSAGGLITVLDNFASMKILRCQLMAIELRQLSTKRPFRTQQQIFTAL
jgi:ribosomal protein L16/L10AE